MWTNVQRTRTDKRAPRRDLQVARAHPSTAGRTLTVEAADTTWRFYDDKGLVLEGARTTIKPIGRFKIHNSNRPPGARPSRARCPRRA